MMKISRRCRQSAAVAALLTMTACGGGGDAGVPNVKDSDDAAKSATVETARTAAAFGPAQGSQAAAQAISSTVNPMEHGIASATVMEVEDATALTVAAASRDDIAADSLQDAPFESNLAVTTDSELSMGEQLSGALSDMSLLNEVVPKGVATTARWRYRAKVTMGTEPYGTSVPAWWTGIRFPEWKAMAAWFVVYPAEDGSPATNALVEIDGVEMWALKASTRTWTKLQGARLPAWQGAFALGSGGRVGSVPFMASSGGGRLFVPSNEYMIHGGLGKVAVPWVESSGADLLAIYAAVRHRLVVKDPSLPDDRASAELGVAVGVDYYPWIGAKLVDLQAKYVPSAGAGRFIRSSTSWRHATVLIQKAGLSNADLLSLPAPALTY